MKRLGVLLFCTLHFSFFCYCQNTPVVISYSYEPAVQHFVVPPGVTTITVTIAGAKGGGTLGGKGAFFTGICPVNENHVLSVVVGQQGDFVGWRSGDTNGGGGGGASWVYDSNVVLYNPSGVTGLIAVAAGGGGGYFVVYGGLNLWSFYTGSPGGVDLATNNTISSLVGADNIGGTGGNGGGEGFGGAGGAGWLSNGQGGDCYSGIDEANHFARSQLINSNCANIYALYPELLRGFGGGGDGRGYEMAGNDGVNGGGGGYNGGGAGYGGGGGGSYLNGTLVGAATVSDTGNGFVTISYLPPLTQVIDIYPNPNSGVFTVNGLLLGQIVEIYDYLGQKIMRPKVVNTFIQLNLSMYANGVYLVVVRNTDSSKAGQWKVVKIQ